MDWSDDQVRQLRELWPTDKSCGQIAQMLGTTKNSVVGKSHRLHLPPRPSPIRPSTEPKAPQAPRSRKVTLAPLSAPAAPTPPPPGIPLRHVSGCQWALNDGRPWRFCEAEREAPSSPYCAEHAVAAFRRAAA